MGISGSGERDELARSYVERLEQALAAATHERDLTEERARLASEGVEQLERRLERGLTESREQLQVREEHLANAKAGIEARDRRLEVAGEKLEARDAELQAKRVELAEQHEKLTAAGARLELLEEELEDNREAGQRAQRELAAREQDLAARVRELGRAGEELIDLEREHDLAREGLVDRERELEAASTLLETQGEQLARARDEARRAAEERDEARRVAEERDEARERLQVREKHLANAKAGIEARDRRLEVAGTRLEVAEGELASRETEVRRLRAAVADRERNLALAETRLKRAQQRAEHFQGSLVELRASRAYRLMRVLWRLRRPFKRAPRGASAGEGEPAPPAETDPPPAAASPSPRLATSSRYPARSRQAGERLRVASILDEMSAACFAPECELVPLRLEGWMEQLDECHPDLLLVESAWNGNDGEWQYRIAGYPREDLAGLPALRALLEACRERCIPTAFWNKEDPVHFERFAEAAALFDHVFTTDARCVERYRALPGERTVAPLPFAAQPRIHNPAAAVAERSASPCFAGAWYRDRHPDRRAALEALLDAARPYGLVIYDRRFGARDEAFGFPERFAPHILGKLPYEQILDVYKSHRVFLNANSVVDSPTMCSRRVFELAACDTAILSTPGAALAALLGEGTVDEAVDEAGAAAALELLLGDEGERRRRTRAARRAVFAAHTYAERLATIAETVGLDASSLHRDPFAVPAGSSTGSGPNGDSDSRRWRLHLQPGTVLAELALADLAAAATFAEADAIGIHPARNGDAVVEHRQVEELDPRALLLSRDLVDVRGVPTGSPEQVQAQLRRWSEEGVRLYAADADLLETRAASSATVAG